MKRFFLLLVLVILSSCAVAVVYRPPKINPEVVKACRDFCRPSQHTLFYRNRYSYFCECSNGLGIIVGSMGTLYR